MSPTVEEISSSVWPAVVMVMVTVMVVMVMVTVTVPLLWSVVLLLAATASSVSAVCW
jgi:hypothetical protein